MIWREIVGFLDRQSKLHYAATCRRFYAVIQRDKCFGFERVLWALKSAFRMADVDSDNRSYTLAKGHHYIMYPIWFNFEMDFLMADLLRYTTHLAIHDRNIFEQIKFVELWLIEYLSNAEITREQSMAFIKAKHPSYYMALRSKNPYLSGPYLWGKTDSPRLIKP